MFKFAKTAIDADVERTKLADPVCGGYASFEGWVRNHNEGLPVTHLEYEAFEELAVREGDRIIAEALARFDVERIACVHRVGDLAIGEMAVWVGVSAKHRAEAFDACRYVIDEVKHRVPIWKKEHYVNGDSGWVNCERCAAPAQHDHAHDHRHDHHHHHDAQGHTHEHAQSHRHSHAQPSAFDYSRQMALPEVGAQGQQRLMKSRVLVIGAGGLGVPVLTYMAGAGVGCIGIVDHDVLDASNLHRQTLYRLADVGSAKVDLAAARLRELNPHIHVRTHRERATSASVDTLLADYDLIIDCTDNFSAKFAINDAAVRARKPAVFASIYQYEGQLQVYRPEDDSACLRCLWPQATRDGVVGNCAEAGVLGPVPGVLGSLQALEVLKILLDLPGQLRNEVILLDLLTLQQTKIRATRCESCQDGQCVRVSAQAAPDCEITVSSMDDPALANFHIIDIRESHEIAAQPAPTSRTVQHLPMNELLANNAGLAADRHYLLVCAQGMRSRGTAEQLRARGLQHVYSLAGGVRGLRASTAAETDRA